MVECANGACSWAWAWMNENKEKSISFTESHGIRIPIYSSIQMQNAVRNSLQRLYIALDINAIELSMQRDSLAEAS